MSTMMRPLYLVALILLEACSQSAELPVRTLVSADFVGCWRVTTLSGLSPEPGLPFWNGGVRLDTIRSKKTEETKLIGPGEYDLYAIGPIPDSLAFDTAATISTWHFDPPDSLVISRSLGLAGTMLQFRVQTDTLRGFSHSYSDVITHNKPVHKDPVIGLRIACSP
jgi:hypothetical protein